MESIGRLEQQNHELKELLKSAIGYLDHGKPRESYQQPSDNAVYGIDDVDWANYCEWRSRAGSILGAKL